MLLTKRSLPVTVAVLIVAAVGSACSGDDPSDSATGDSFASSATAPAASSAPVAGSATGSDTSAASDAAAPAPGSGATTISDTGDGSSPVSLDEALASGASVKVQGTTGDGAQPRYTFQADQSQLLNLSVASDGGVSFGLTGPDGEAVRDPASGAGAFTTVLAAPGEYQVVINGPAAGAPYEMTVRLR